MILSPQVLRAFRAHAVACYPGEACGVVLREPDGTLRFRPMENVAHRPDAYLFDIREQLEVFGGSAEVVAIAHSHCEAGTYFSARDREEALGGGQTPLFPGVEYLVISVRIGPGGVQAEEIRAYRFVAGQFQEHRLERLPPGAPPD